MKLVLALALIAGCDHSDPDLSLGGSGSGSGKTKGSAGGFSASLTADLAKTDASVQVAPGSAVAITPAVSSADQGTLVGSAAEGRRGSIDAGATPGSGSVKPAIAPVPVPVGSGGGSSKPPDAGSNAGSASPPKVHGIVKVSPELAAIKLSLLPNWVRDVDEGATFSLPVHVPGKDDIVQFTFHYGYDEAKAPDDHDGYMKYLADNKILGGTGPGGIVGLNRQRGAAWYLEGADASGPAFRYLVMYGGKHLVCYGSLYKDSVLGDTRDEVIMQAKKICESLTL